MDDDGERQITAAQAAARRENGKRFSTGPRTEAGKAASSRNAVRHGLWSRMDPVGDTGLFAEDSAAFDELRAGLRGAFDVSVPLIDELVEALAAVLWRLRRVPAFEALLLQEEDSIQDRLADRTRELLDDILQAEDYLRQGGIPLEERSFIRMADLIHHWGGWELGDVWDPEDDVPASDHDRAELVETLLKRRWSSWEQAADHALMSAREAEDLGSAERREAAIVRTKRLVSLEFLTKLNRPEAHLARERDRLLSQIRIEEDRSAADRSLDGPI